MPNTIKTISLTDDDKSYLNKLLTQSTLEIRVYQRARILLLKSEGASNKAIADKLDIGISVVKRCLNKFKENGVEASLRDNKGRGRKAEITDDDITWVISKACQKPKDYGYSAEFWYPMSFRKFINSIAETEGHPRMATVAETTLRKILSNARIKPFQVSYYCERRDPEFDAKMHDVLVIYKQIEMQFVAGYIRARSAAALITPHALLLEEVENADELLAQMPADPQCTDIVTRAGAKDTYYYSNANMSDNYAMIAQLIEDKDLCVMFAEMVRFNARIYPSATPLKYFQRSPYGLAPEEIEQTWKTMQGRPEFADIEELTNNQNERFLFSTKHLTRRYAKAISDVDDFCD